MSHPRHMHTPSPLYASPSHAYTHTRTHLLVVYTNVRVHTHAHALSHSFMYESINTVEEVADVTSYVLRVICAACGRVDL